jgi:hypothetical protein
MKCCSRFCTESQEDPYFSLIVHFAIEFEKTYIHWLYEVLDVVENRQKQALLDDGGASSQ